MFLRNHGVVCCGESVEEAFLNTYYTILACETQVIFFYRTQVLSSAAISWDSFKKNGSFTVLDEATTYWPRQCDTNV